MRILDLEGNQAVDTLFYGDANPRERYDPQRALRRQGRVYLTTGSVLHSNLGRPMLTIVADTCGRHDTLGGACAQESNTVRYALEKLHMHSENWVELAEYLEPATININGNKVDREQVEAIIDLGKPILAYTINDPQRFRTLQSWGVDGVFTDVPDVIKDAILTVH